MFNQFEDFDFEKRIDEKNLKILPKIQFTNDQFLILKAKIHVYNEFILKNKEIRQDLLEAMINKTSLLTSTFDKTSKNGNNIIKLSNKRKLDSKPLVDTNRMKT